MMHVQEASSQVQVSLLFCADTSITPMPASKSISTPTVATIRRKFVTNFLIILPPFLIINVSLA